jgi:hypothetical protein
MTMNSLLGDERSELERYQMMRTRLESSTHRALREVRLLQADARKNGTLGPSPYSAQHEEVMQALGRQLDIDDVDEEDEEEEQENAPAQDEPNPPESAATPVDEEACDEPRAQNQEQTTPILRDTMRKVQQQIIDAETGEQDP